MSNRQFWIALSIILASSLIIRLVSADHGLPHISSGDEASDLSNAVRLTQGELIKERDAVVRSLIAFTDLAAVGGLFGYTFITGEVSSVSEFQDLYFSDRWMFTLATRWMIAILSVIGMGVVALCGRYIKNEVGIFAALVLATNNFFLLNTIYALPDGLVILPTALALWLILRVWKHQRTLDYILIGLGFGLVFYAKVQALAVGAGFLIAHWVVVRNNEDLSITQTLIRYLTDRRGWMAFGAFIVGVLLFNPLWVFEPRSMTWGVPRLIAYAFEGNAAPGDRWGIITSNLIGQIGEVWQTFLIPSLIGIGVIGIKSYRKNQPYWIVFAAFTAMFLLTANVTSFFYKHFFWMPWMIPMAILSGVGLVWLWDFGKRGGLHRIAYIVILLVFAFPTYYFVDLVITYSHPDTRQEALAFAQENWESGTAVMSGDTLIYSVPFLRTEESILRAQDLLQRSILSWEWWLEKPDELQSSPAFNIFGPEMQIVYETYQDVEETLTEENVEYYVVADLCQGFWMEPQSNIVLDFPPTQDGFIDGWEQVAVFSPFDVDDCLPSETEPFGIVGIDDRTGLVPIQHRHRQIQPGPIIRIYRVDLDQIN